MTSVAKKRLQNDYKRLMQEKEFYVYAKPKENNILLIDGKQFVKMLLNVGIESLESFEDY